VIIRIANSVLCAVVLLLVGVPGAAEDHVVLDRDGAKVYLSGRIVVEAQDGGVLLLDQKGKLWTAQPDEIKERSKDEFPFRPLDKKKLAEAMLKELPEGFEVHTTAHYLICHNTSKAYAQWCGSLFERLYFGFTNFWKRRGMKLHEPEMPLVAIVFADERSYKRYAVNQLGDAVKSIIGYYNLLTNHVVMYDLTGSQKIRRGNNRGRNTSEINQMLARPEAGSLVATVIHEATHQIAFNCGLQTRLADIPIWLSEGIAMYFETPDLRSSSGWRGIGAVNRARLVQFRSSLRSRPRDSLVSLLTTDRRIQGRSKDKRYQSRGAVLNSYAESWCLTYYLMKHKPEDFVDYLKTLAAKQPLFEDTPEQRRALFERHFGSLPSLDQDFLRQTRKLK
jgi:hypothetical protein